MLPKITVEGTLTADPELRFTPSGAAVANFTVACNDRKMNAETHQWEDSGEPLFLRCAVWRQQAENVAESLRKGYKVIVTGKLKQRSYETREGEKRTSIELDVDEVAPSLRWVTATINRAQRGSDSAPGTADDPWASAGPANDEPPF